MPVELDESNRAAFETTLAASHRIRTRYEVFDRNEDFIDELDVNIIGGQVDVDGSADISRTLHLTIADPSYKFYFSREGALFIDKMLQVWYGVFVDSLNDWVETPVFFGPVSHFSRDGAEVSIEAQSKEMLWLPPRTQVRPPGTAAYDSVAQYIKQIATAFGETRTGGLSAFGNTKVPKDFNLDVTLDKDEPKEDKNKRPTIKIDQPGSWGLVQKLAHGVGYQLYYNTRGELHARPYDSQPVVFTFRDGEGGTMLSEPAMGYDHATFANVVRVESKDPNRNIIGPIVTTVYLATSHPMSKESLAWNGVDREYVHKEKYNHPLAPDAAMRRAKSLLDEMTRVTQEVQFEALTVPHLQVGDTVAVQTGNISDTFRAVAFTVPLTAADSMSFGYNKRVLVEKTEVGKVKQKRSHKKRKRKR